MVTFDTRPMPRRGVGDTMDDILGVTQPGFGAVAPANDSGIFGYISDFAQGGSGQMGELSDFLVRTGYTIEVVRNALQNIAAVGAPAPVVDYAAQELRYLNNTGTLPNQNTSLFIVLGLGALLLLASRNR